MAYTVVVILCKMEGYFMIIQRNAARKYLRIWNDEEMNPKFVSLSTSLNDFYPKMTQIMKYFQHQNLIGLHFMEEPISLLILLHWIQENSRISARTRKIKIAHQNHSRFMNTVKGCGNSWNIYRAI